MTTSPQQIYSYILDEINKILEQFEVTSDEEEIAQAQIEGKKKLNSLAEDVQKAMSELERNSEWNVFTIAFYGETNAGKSTLIETLRILLNEPKKVQERKEFSRLLTEYNKLNTQIQEFVNSLQKIKNKFDSDLMLINANKSLLTQHFEKKESDIAASTAKIKQLLQSAKIEKKHSFIKFFKYLFKKLPQQIEARQITEAVKNLESEKLNIELQKAQELQKEQSLMLELKSQTNTLEHEAAVCKQKQQKYSEQLKSLSDGLIIGDGRSDFTREVTTYDFESNNQKFALLDLPGIEGNEGMVLSNINNAVQKAHAVFYVTGKPTPPQTNDENGEGTLEKIKKHLGQQTEVYTIYNKRAANPKMLNDPLVDSQDERESLRDLDSKMKQHLGDQYQKSIALSAYPAFLSVANCWDNDFSSKKQKFLEHFSSADNLLDKSFLRSFSHLLTGELVSNCKIKIKKSNFKKASIVLNAVIDKIKNIHNTFTSFQSDLENVKENTDEQLDDSVSSLLNKLETQGSLAVRNFQNNVRQKIYEKIDSEINNDTFKDALRKYLEDGVVQLQSELENKINEEIKSFQDEVEGIVKKYEKYAEELLSSHTGKIYLGRSIDLNIKLKSGVNWLGLVSSVAGAVVSVLFFISNPVGWVALAVSIAGALFSAAKAVLGFFNHKFRMSEQKKSADKNIEDAGGKISESIKKNLDETQQPLAEGVENIKAEIQKSITHVQKLNDILAMAHEEFRSLMKNVQVEGVR